MNQPTKITTLFLDIGGVLLSDGWTLDMRGQAAQTFDLDPVQLESLHHQVFATYELGKISLDEYLERCSTVRAVSPPPSSRPSCSPSPGRTRRCSP
jgi:hypothetical protein